MKYMQDCNAVCRYVNFVQLQNRVEHRFCKLFQLKYSKIFWWELQKKVLTVKDQCSVCIIFPHLCWLFLAFVFANYQACTKKASVVTTITGLLEPGAIARSIISIRGGQIMPETLLLAPPYFIASYSPVYCEQFSTS